MKNDTVRMWRPFEDLTRTLRPSYQPRSEDCVLAIHKAEDERSGDDWVPCEWALRCFQFYDCGTWWFLYLTRNPQSRTPKLIWTSKRLPQYVNLAKDLNIQQGYSAYQGWQDAVEGACRLVSTRLSDKEWVGGVIEELHSKGWIDDDIHDRVQDGLRQFRDLS